MPRFFNDAIEPRCEQKKIVQMLHAVHLLLTEAGQDTPIIVLLAVDPRIIEAAVEDSFGLALRKEVPQHEVNDVGEKHLDIYRAKY